MACTTEQLLAVDRLLDGCPSNGGLDAVAYVINHSDIEGVTRDATTKVVESITLKSGATAYKWVGKRQSWSMTANKPAGSAAWLQTLNLVFNINTALDRDKFEKLAAASELVVIVQDNNESFKIFGLGLTSTNTIAPLSGLDQSEGNMDITVDTAGDTTARLARSGEINNLPLDFLVDAGTLATTKTYLEGLLA
jgi:hypothetical protein